MKQHVRSGQALTEYALILVMVAILFGVTLAATGPAIGNVFSNVIYNIIGGRPEDIERLADADGRGRDEAFWATVQWLIDNPPEEKAGALNTPLPPPATATEGPSPTPTPITPSPLPTNTPTATPTSTPDDKGQVAPWLDKINNPEWWRVDSNVWLGSDQFFGQYYANETLSSTPSEELWHGEIGFPDVSAVNFNWPSGSGPIESGFTTNNYSVRWTRQIGFGWGQTAPQPMKVRFSLTTGGGQSGARLWLYELGAAATPTSACSSVSSGGTRTSSSAVYADGQSPSGSATDCLVIDAWRDNEESLSVVRTLDPQKLYVIEVDFYKRSGDGQVKLGIDGLSSGNPDDASTVSGNPVQCDWYRADTQRSNSTMFIWEEARVGEFPQNMACYLELRGYVDFTLLSNPKLIFWDVWDMSNANTKVWLEVGEYKADRTTIAWQKVDLRQGTTNYAWTRNILNLAPYISGFSQKRLALRFGMSDNNGGTRRRWYVDDIEIRDFGTKTFGVCTGSMSTCTSYWNMDDAEFTLGSANKGIDPQFVTTGRWTLSNSRAQGKLSFDSGPAIRSNEVGGGNRIHFVEFNGLIDVTGNIPDFDGDTGVAVLTFHQSYEVNNGTQLELQWTRDTPDQVPDTWQTLEVLVSDPGSGGTATQGLEETTVLLDGITAWDAQPFRLRFAQIVKPGAEESGGWWIDNILIHRFDKPRFSDYPFSDTAQGGMENWLAQGQWGQTAPGDTNFTPNLFEGSGIAFADSPGGNYLEGSNASLILKHPLDLNYDTPENVDLLDDSNIQTVAAVKPRLSFWTWRNMKSTHEFYVEWSNDEGQNWKAIWQYVPQSVSLSNSYDQRAWEYIEIDLSDIQANVATNAASPYDDDILLRFRLDARGSGTDDGIYIDDIFIKDYSESKHKLWDPDVDDATYGTGDSSRYTDDIDTPIEYWDRWRLGGWYGAENFQHSGLLSLHDSPVNKNGNMVTTRKHTYNVLGLEKIIDLRALTASDNPTLYFWTRYEIGTDDNIQLQIAPESTAYKPTDGLGVSNTFDYQRVAGWGNWENRWERPANSRVDTWFRAPVDLRSYVGKRIKVRFVLNALNNSDKKDGWFIDDIIFEHRSTQPIPLPFRDGARSMGNWVAEGSWGLAPDQWRGSGGGPADIGNDFWTGVYYDCERHYPLKTVPACGSTDDYTNLLYTTYTSSNKVKRAYDPSIDIQEFALEIDHDFGSNLRPVGGTLDQTWDEYYAARWERPIQIGAPSDVTFITVSDDGVRLRYSGPGAPTNKYWNIIERWTFHGRTVDIATVSFAAGNYNLTLEWFEHGGSAVIILSAGVNNFSFADSPKAGNGPTFQPINSTKYGNSSLMLKSPIDLTGSSIPAIQYWTRYKLASSTARVQVSTNGGFDWLATNLNTGTGGFTCPPSTTCSSIISGGMYWPDDPGQWQRRQHNLSPYKANGLINLRFNLVTADSVDDGWYVTDIEINP
ncbi:MAG: hypothetical protein K8J31_29515 [Anaerolineae bacterium]|nr:hypothetical protein [Anaerolineae bacterium]